MKLPLAATAFAVLAGCISVQPTSSPILDLATLKADAAGTLNQYMHKRIRTAGYYMVDRLETVCTRPGDGQARDVPSTYLDLSLSRAKFERTVHRWVFLEATVEQPKDMLLGGGDLFIEVRESDQDFYLKDAKIVSIDPTQLICR
jgi:hypothetical protein